MTVKRRTSLVASLVCSALLIATATVGAATITGTAANDTLRGGVKADKLNGKAGNDKLYGAAGNDVLSGGAGNDLLVGGPGADTLSCGPGTDTARGDARDKVRKDCEVVKGIPTTPPPPPPPPPPHRHRLPLPRWHPLPLARTEVSWKATSSSSMCCRTERLPASGPTTYAKTATVTCTSSEPLTGARPATRSTRTEASRSRRPRPERSTPTLPRSSMRSRVVSTAPRLRAHTRQVLSSTSKVLTTRARAVAEPGPHHSCSERSWPEQATGREQGRRRAIRPAPAAGSLWATPA